MYCHAKFGRCRSNSGHKQGSRKLWQRTCRTPRNIPLYHLWSFWDFYYFYKTVVVSEEISELALHREEMRMIRWMWCEIKG